MAYRSRIEMDGGTYYVWKRISPPFATHAECARFESRFGAVARRHRARVFGFCWLADSIHFALQVGDVPLHEFMASLPRRRIARSDNQPRTRYRSLLIEPDAYLPGLVCYLHWLPVLRGSARGPDDYAQTSHGAYVKRRHIRWLDTRAASANYHARMREPPALERIHEFEHGSEYDPRILGGLDFINTLPWSYRPHRSIRTLPEIATSVARFLGVEVEAVRSNSRAHDLVLARALIAHVATSRKVATWREVGAYLNHAYSMLYAVTKRYRERDPTLFNAATLRYSGPLLRIPDAKGVHHR